MHVLSLIALLAALILPTAVLADAQIFTATHTYVLGDDDSRNTARQKCLAEAKRKILEQVGVYLESQSDLVTSSQAATSGSAKSPKTTNEERQQITERITTLTAGIMKTEVVKEEFGDVNGRLRMTLTVKADVDSDDIQRQLAAQRADQGVRKQVKEQEQRIEELETQLRAMMQGMQGLGEDERGGSKQSTKRTVVPDDVVSIRELASKGNATAQVDLGAMYMAGEGVPQSDTEAVAWYRKAAGQGDAEGQVELGWTYALGRGVPQSDTKAVTWFRKAAKQGDADGQVGLGRMYESGKGVPQSNTEAVVWYRKAAEQGNADGEAGLGRMYLNTGEYERGGSRQSAKSANGFIREYANEGSAIAQAYLGLMYVTGKDKSYSDAVIWFRKAAAQGNGYGQAGLGWMYVMGRGVPQSDTEAVAWFRKAAQQGNAIGQFNLGMMYLHGIGIPQGNTEAVMWFRKAAEQGHPHGVLALHAIDGVGPKDKTEFLDLVRKPSEQVIAAMWQTGPGTLNLNYQTLERRGKP